jgi:serine/threonine protein kinase
MIGRTLSHYKVIAPLGAGGMGIVYRGEDTRLGREVAIKFVSEDAALAEQAVNRLRSEARAASALNHPNICTIYDIGEDDGHPFIVMELMKGQTLRERLAGGLLKVHHLVDIGIEISDALHATHTDGIIHRDIKPGNIFLTDRGHVKIMDFGLAKLTPRFAAGSGTTFAAAEQTGVGVTIGTVSYMSPEQAAGEELDGRTDLFSLGVVLYECATGRHPFPGKTSAVILAAILNRTPVAPVTINPELPLRLQDIINNCLEKDRELRYQSAADVRADLKRLRRDLESGHSRAIEISAGSRTAGDAHSHPDTAHQSGSAATAGSSAALRIVAAVVVVAALVGGYGLWRMMSRPAAGETSAATPSNTAVTSRLSLARASLDARNYRAAATYADSVLEIEPGQAEALRIRDEARTALAHFDDAIADARGQLARGDTQAAARSLETARAIDASAPSVSEVAARIEEAARQRTAATRETAVAPPPPPPAVRERPAPRASPPPPHPAPTTGTTPVEPAAAPPIPERVVPPPVRSEPPPPSVPAAPEPAPSRPAEAPPPPPETARPTESARPGPTADEIDDAAIRRVVAAYGRAIETKDLVLFRSIKPNLSPDEERRLQQAFRAVTSQRVTLTIASIDRRADAASVVVQRRDVLEVGGRRQNVDARQTLTFALSGNGWVITEIR